MSDCKLLPNGKISANSSNWATCRPWDITTQDKANTYIDSLTQEALAIAGAQINVHKMLGVHEQTLLTDLTGSGTAMSGGDAPNYPASNAFTTHRTEWRSSQVGDSVAVSSYIGYDFGIIRLANGRQRYGVDANTRQHITTIRIKQSSNPKMRATKVRVERSDDRANWYGAAVITLPNDDALNTISFKQSVPSRYWRLRPLTFLGGTCDSWGIQALELIDYAATAVDNIQDPIWMENRDRDYQQTPILLKGYYDLLTVNTELLQLGMGIPSAIYTIKLNFNACVTAIGRPIVVGDILELPSETQFTPDLRPVKRYLEVTDITWDSGSYTPGWMPTMLAITAQPALASQETRDIFGDLAFTTDNSGLFNGDDGNSQTFQDFSAITQTIQADARTAVPEKGSEGSNTVREFSDADYAAAQAAGLDPAVLQNMTFNRTGLYVEDAMPQNGAPYAEGPELPPVNRAKDGDYHRLTYVGLASDVPARLYRYSATKNRWLYLETDRRAEFDSQKVTLNEYLTSPYKISEKAIR
jgi:hypothetical protein